MEMPTLSATLFDIQSASYVDGPGIRTTVFFKGCNLRCAWCHNPESQSPAPQMMFYASKCIGCGKCKEVCPAPAKDCTLCGKCALYCPGDARKVCGKVYTVEEVMRSILADRAFYEATGGGVTFSGGECMLQLDFLEEMLRCCKEENIHTCVDTAGHVPWTSFERILPYTDLFLYDVKSLDSDKHKQYVGVDNSLILSNLSRLLQKEIPVWVRYPLIPGVNDGEDDKLRLQAFYSTHGRPQKTEILPYHKMGENKYSAIGRNVQPFSVPAKEITDSFRQAFEFPLP